MVYIVYNSHHELQVPQAILSDHWLALLGIITNTLTYAPEWRGFLQFQFPSGMLIAYVQVCDY